jgi:hypothetical protein
MKLLLNAIKCLHCQDIIASRARHEFKSCKCGKVAVDGGLDYKRRVGHLELIQERCGYEWDPKVARSGDAAGKYIVWSPGGRTNPAMIFDCQEDAALSAIQLAVKVPVSDWYVAQLTHVPVAR